MSSESDKPYGRAAVVDALIEAAADLFSKFGVDAISIRDIALRANVNHGLIHRHFGTKDTLRRKTQEHLAAAVRDEVGIPENFRDALLRGFGYELFDAARPARERVPLENSVENTLAYPPGWRGRARSAAQRSDTGSTSI